MTNIYLIDKNIYQSQTKFKELPSNFIKLNNNELHNTATLCLYDILTNIYHLKDISIRYNKLHKPYLANNQLYFNISHSNNLIVIIVSEAECSIDIEMIKNRPNLNSMAKKLLNEEDYNHYLVDLSFFYVIWTKKEAYYKYNGNNLIFKKNYQFPDKYEVIKTMDTVHNSYFITFFYQDSQFEVKRYEK